jgi:hypothetical protein
MEREPNWEEQLLKELGFEHVHQLRRYLNKLCAFLQSLEPQEQRVLLASLPSEEDALRSLRLDITPEELGDLLRKRVDNCSGVFLGARKFMADDDSDEAQET